MPREAEVADVRVIPAGVGRDEDVARLHVPVDETRGVGGIESRGDVLDESDSPARLEAALAAEQLAQIRTLDVVHREVEVTLVLARSERLHGVRMVERRRQLGLAQEAPAKTLVAGEFAREELQRDAAPGARLLREVDRSHRPLSEERLHAKAGDD